MLSIFLVIVFWTLSFKPAFFTSSPYQFVFSSLLSAISVVSMAPHSSILAWTIPWMEEPGGLQSMGSLGVGHDWATSLSLFTFMHWKRKWQPIQCSCLENPRDRGAWWAAVYGVAQSRTQLTWLSSSNSIFISVDVDISPSDLYSILGFMQSNISNYLSNIQVQ